MIEIIYNLIWENNIKINNENENNDDNKCNKCNKILSSKYYLQKHLLICKGVSNPLECHICNKIYSSSSSKSKHLKICRHKTNEININENLIKVDNENLMKFDNENLEIEFDINHLNNNEIKSKLLTLKDDYIFEYYCNKLFENKNNQIIKKSNIKTNYSLVFIGNNIWKKYMDKMIYPIIIREISKLLLLLDIKKKEINEYLIKIEETEYKKTYKYNINMLKLIFNSFL